MRQMKEQKIKFTPIPSTAEVKAERDRLAYRRRYLRVLRSTVYALLVVAAVAVLLATLFLPVLQVSGDSMNPTLQDKDIILLVKTGDMKTGDLCGFYWQNKLLLKRVIGLPGDVVTLDEDGVVTVNGQTLDEPYVDELALGECAIKIEPILTAPIMALPLLLVLLFWLLFAPRKRSSTKNETHKTQ